MDNDEFNRIKQKCSELENKCKTNGDEFNRIKQKCSELEDKCENNDDNLGCLFLIIIIIILCLANK